MISVAILGYGVVGSGVAEVLKKNASSISVRSGEEITVKKILDIREFPDSPHRDLLTSKAEEVFDDDSISIVVETIGGAKIAHEFTKRALSAGKHVVTSNKELVATHGPELMKLAKENGVSYFFEASVGGGIPIIRPLYQCLAANEITGITGILNGTTNYILSQMKREGKSFKEALKGAQDNGYAEADPTADVEGHDACRKIAILSSIAFNQFVDYKGIYTEGIAKLSLEDMRYADKMDSVIKLIAKSEKMGDKVFARVSPAIIKKGHPLANVEDVFNAIVVKGNAIGDAMFYGRGAGKLPTASAVVADIIDIARHMDGSNGNVWHRKEYDNIADIKSIQSAFFVRLSVEDTESASWAVEREFGKVDFYKQDKGGPMREIAFVTPKIDERSFEEKVEDVKGIGTIKNIINWIRIEEE